MAILPPGFKVRERIRETLQNESFSNREHREALQRQYQRERQKRETAWNDGFKAAVKMLENGATLERLQAAVGEGPFRADEISDGVPVFARGTRDFEKEDTEPTSAPFNPDIIITDVG